MRGIWTTAALILVLAPGARPQEEPPQQEPPKPEGPRWPREYTGEKGGTLVLYQPQIESWQNYRTIKAWFAMSLKAPGSKDEILGSMQLRATTSTDNASRTVVLDKFHIEKLTVPDLDAKKTRELREALKLILPKEPVSTSLDNVLGNLERTSIQSREVKVSNKAPEFIVTLKEMILISFDGDPMWEEIPDTGLKIGLNTSAAIFMHGTDVYLLYEKSWLESPGLSGPWTPAEKLPDGFSKLPDDDRSAFLKKNIPGFPLKTEEVPRVRVVTKPTELVVIYGSPQLESVPGTRLSYVKNSEADLFLLDGTYYLLVSGRWFKSTSLTENWTFCTPDLPADFRRIPESHECGRVLASVPSTDQAKEAAIENQIPRMAQVDRKAATLVVSYDGEPSFARIEGTAVEYADNTTFDVFRCEGKVYCCYEAVWFVADAPTGPWAPCDNVPKAIYDIPSTHPAYNCTYVAVYDSNADYIYNCYTPGYYGSYYVGGVVVYGCGWRWRWRRAYWRHYWRPRPTPYLRRRMWARHHTYGQGRYYDHATGRYRRSNAVRATSTQPMYRAGAYQAWKGGAVRRPAVAQRQVVRRPTPAKGRNNNHYAGRDGSHYRKQGNQWQRYSNGKWHNTFGPNTRRQPTQHLNRSYRARQSSYVRRSQYNRYRASRGGGRTRAYRGGGRRGGGRR